MNVIDAVIVILLLVGVLGGMKRGAIKELVMVSGIIIVVALSFALKNPIASFFFRFFPFFNITGTFEGVSAINILIYEVIAFLIVFGILFALFRIILKVTGVIETVLNMTIILGAASKLIGGFLGLIESYIIIFVLLFFFHQPFVGLTIGESKLGSFILNRTPFLSGVVEDTVKAVDELYSLSKKFNNNKNSKEYNNEAIDVFLKYKIIDGKSIQILREKGKI